MDVFRRLDGRGGVNRAAARAFAKSLLVLPVLVTVFLAPSAVAGQDTVYDVEVSLLAVNGGSDTANPGVTCLQLSSPINAVCPVGWIAIRNNNPALLAAALQAKASKERVYVYYDMGQQTYHCPGQTQTPCSLISILIP